MAFLWEDYNTKREYKLAKKNYCPYTEIFQTQNNESKVNIMYRFSNVMNSLLDSCEAEEKIIDSIGNEGFNTLFHLLANIDSFSGITDRDFRMMELYNEIYRGDYGIDVVLFNKLTFRHKYKILSYMLLRREDDCRNNLFFDCLTELFDVSLDYSEFADTYIIQVHGEKDYVWNGSYTSENLYNLIKNIMCDFWIKTEVYWKIPIGIVGEEMRINYIQII